MKPNITAPDLLTVKETAAYLRIPTPTIYHLIHRGQLPAIQIGKRWRIKKELLDRDILHNAPVSRSVVVVEPEQEDQQFFRAAFAPFGVPISLASNSAEALDVLEDTEPCMVMVSLHLEDGSATSLYHTLRERLPDLPIVITMERPDDEALATILRDGPVTVLKKPIKRQHLKQIIQVYCHADTEA